MDDIQALISEITRLSRSVDVLNAWRIVLMAVTAAAAGGLVMVQHVTVRRSRQLAAAQSALLTAKDEKIRGELADKDVKIGAANKAAANAAEGAARALAEQEKLRQENLKLSIRFEEERTARLKIEERLAPRRLTQEQQNSVTTKLRDFPGEKLNIQLPGDDPEITHLANQLLACFEGAGWHVATLVGTDMSRSVSGILIEIDTDASSSSRKAAVALASALRAENVAVGGPMPPSGLGGSGMFIGGRIDAKIKMTIGKK